MKGLEAEKWIACQQFVNFSDGNAADALDSVWWTVDITVQGLWVMSQVQGWPNLLKDGIGQPVTLQNCCAH